MERKDSIIGIYFVTFWIYIVLFIWNFPFLVFIFLLDDFCYCLLNEHLHALYLNSVWFVILNLLKLGTCYELIILSELIIF